MALAGVALLAGACGSSATPSPSNNKSGTGTNNSKSPYIVHAVLGLTGQASTLADKEKKAFLAYQNMVNAQGGIDGHPVKIQFQDDMNSPKTSVQLMNSLISQHVPFILGPTLGSSAAADSTLFHAGGPVDYALSPAFPPPKFGSYVFSAALSFPSAAEASLEYVKSKGWTKVAFLNSTDTTGKSADTAFKAALALPQFKSLQVVKWEHFDVSAVNVSAQMTAISAAHPQVLISFATGSPLETVIKGAVNNGIMQPIITDDGNMTFNEFKTLSTMPPGGLFISSGAWGAASVMPNGPEKTADMAFLNQMKKAGIKPDVGAVIPWDPMAILLSAVKKYGINATGQQIHSYIESLKNYPGVMGTYDFTVNTPASRQRGLSTSSDYIYQWDPSKQNWIPVSQGGGKALK